MVNIVDQHKAVWCIVTECSEEGFIHVQHIVPLNKIGKKYVVDYKNDLIPACPNCCAMLHKIVHGKEVAVEELKELLMMI